MVIKVKTSWSHGCDKYYIRGLLRILSHYGWKETKGKDYDVWFQGLCFNYKPKKDSKRVVYIHAEDEAHNIKKRIDFEEKDSVWLTNIIYDDEGYILGHPIIRNSSHIEYKKKKRKAFFIGQATSIERVKMFEQASDIFDGGLVGTDWKLPYKKFYIKKLPISDYYKKISEYGLLLCPTGHSPLCYRFFESCHFGCCTLNNTFEHLKFRRGNLKVDVHYLVKFDINWKKAIERALKRDIIKIGKKARKEYERYFCGFFDKKTPLGNDIDKDLRNALGL